MAKYSHGPSIRMGQALAWVLSHPQRLWYDLICCKLIIRPPPKDKFAEISEVDFVFVRLRVVHMKLVRFAPFLLFALLISTAPALAELPADLQLMDVIAVDGIADTKGLSPAADLLSVGVFQARDTGQVYLRISFLSLSEHVPGQLAEAFVKSGRPSRIRFTVLYDNSESDLSSF